MTKQIERFNPREPLFLLIDYFRIRFPTTNALAIIRDDVLYQAVLERLQYWAKVVQQDEEKVLNKIQKVGNEERIREKKKKATSLKKAENRQTEIDCLFAKMYEDRAYEKITEGNFIMLSSNY